MSCFMCDVMCGAAYWTGTLASDDAVPFRMVGAAGRPVPGSLYLTWDGQGEGVAVAVAG